MIPCPFSSSPVEHKKHVDVWVKRWQCESQGEEGCLDADYSMKGRLYEGENTGCNSLRKADLLAVGAACCRAGQCQGTPRSHGGSHNIVPCGAMLCGWRTSGLPCLRLHHCHCVLCELEHKHKQHKHFQFRP